MAAGNTTRIEDYINVINMKTLAVTTVVGLADFGFSQAEMDAADYLIVSTFGNAANFSRVAGAVPTTTFGIPVEAGRGAIGYGGNAAVKAFQVVAQTGTAAVTVELSKY